MSLAEQQRGQPGYRVSKGAGLSVCPWALGFTMAGSITDEARSRTAATGRLSPAQHTARHSSPSRRPRRTMHCCRYCSCRGLTTSTQPLLRNSIQPDQDHRNSPLCSNCRHKRGSRAQALLNHAAALAWSAQSTDSGTPEPSEAPMPLSALSALGSTGPQTHAIPSQ